MPPPRVLAFAALALLAVNLTGCAQPSVEARPSPSPTPMFATDAAALAAATNAYARYLEVTQEIMRGEGQERLAAITTGKELDADEVAVREWIAAGSRLEGSASFFKVSLARVIDRLHSDGSQVIISLCEDNSAVDVIGPDGGSLVRPDRRPSTLYEVVLLSERGKLKVSDRRVISEIPC